MLRRMLVLGLAVGRVGWLTAQVPAGYHLSAPVILPDTLTETLLGGRFRATVRRAAKAAREREMLMIAERLYPDHQTLMDSLLASSHNERQRNAYVAADTADVDTARTDGGRIRRRPPGPLVDRWWMYAFDGTFTPYAVTGQGVQYYLERMRDLASQRSSVAPNYPDPVRGTFRYTARVEKVHEGGAAYVVRMQLRWEYECGMLCALWFEHSRAVWFDANGNLLRVTGDGPIEVLVS